MTLNDFSRRQFIKTIGLGTAAASLPAMGFCSNPRLDQYGGLESIKFNSTGFFRVEKGDRWWLVTPDGSAFISYGINHTDIVYLLQDYNIDHWKTQFNFKDEDDPALRDGFVNKVLNDIKFLGMNTMGCHAQKPIFGNLTVPYLQGLFFARTAYWSLRSQADYPDVYSSQFEERCRKKAELVVLPKKDDPFLIGYTLTNVPILTDMDADAHGMTPWGRPQSNRPTWPRALRNRGPASPGKRVFVELMKEKYSEINDFNDVYHTDFSSFDALLNAVNWSPFIKDEKIDDHDDHTIFLMDIYDRYLQVTCGAIRTYDSNHLIFGDPLNANTGTTDEIVSLVAKHTDLISYQYYGPYKDQVEIIDRWSKLTGKPLFNTDSNFSVPRENQPNPVGYHCPDNQALAAYFLDYATQAFSRPDFIGWHWCGWVDGWESWRGIQQHCGLQDPFGNWHEPMPEVMSKFGSQLYDYALGKRKPKIYTEF
jgi:hypothetical protein